MADYREVQYGHDMFMYALNQNQGQLRKEFISALDACFPGVAVKAIQAFDNHWQSIRSGTYISCISEHSGDEDLHGRLSMWRAFSPSVPRVAIVLSIPFASTIAEKLRVIFSSVGYLSQDKVCDELRRVITNIRTHSAILMKLKQEEVFGFAFIMFLAGVTCLKHEGFHEEREWRALYFPQLPLLPASPLMQSITAVIGGVPQTIFTLPLDKNVTPDVADIDLAKILDRLIIGPTQYGEPMRQAFVQALQKLGVSDAKNRVVVSSIPIRT
jgi:hypothetical protein